MRMTAATWAGNNTFKYTVYDSPSVTTAVEITVRAAVAIVAAVLRGHGILK